MENTNTNSQQTTESPGTANIQSNLLKKILLFLLFLILLLSFIIGIRIYFNSVQLKEKETAKSLKKTSKIIKTASASVSKFATYEELPLNINPKIPVYSVNKNLSNITNKDDFQFSDAAKNLLVKNAFVVIPAFHQEFYSLYEKNRYDQLPSLITTDSILHNYHLMFDHLLRKLEEEKLIPELKSLNEAMLSAALEQYNTLQGTDWGNAAKRNVGFFAVGSRLLDIGVNIPSAVKNEVEQEFALIEAHQNIDRSPVMIIGTKKDIEEFKEDYSQYVPRGHYDKNDQLKAYFKSMMWYGRMTFRLKNTDEIKSALLMTLTLNQESNHKSWDKIYEPINFFVGKSDDITYYQFRDLLEKIYGSDAALQTIVKDDVKLASLIESAKKLEPPQINSMPIFQASIQSDREKEIKGFRFMGQRFTLDASIFQRLVYREVGDKSKTCQQFKPEETGCLTGARCLPKGLDIPAAMGSSEALNILEKQGETKYACYRENMSKMKDYLSGLDTDIWTQNLYWGWLYSLHALTSEKTEGYPTFMRNLAWVRKELNTYLGSWTELKRDTILYAKQVYAEMGGGPSEEKDYRGYVEPNPDVYARLASLLKMTNEGLRERNLLSGKNKDNLEKLEQLALSLKTISEKELNNEKLTNEEHSLIKSYGGQLEHIWYEIFSEDYPSPILDDDTNAPVVADVATDPNGQVLEEGTGFISEIYAVVPVEGKLRIAKGGVYSYYEFPWPLTDRLTDTKWKEMLRSDKAPILPEWTNEFIAN